VGPRTSLDDVERRKILALPGFVLRTLDRPARSLSLYRLRYHGSRRVTHIQSNYRFIIYLFLGSGSTLLLTLRPELSNRLPIFNFTPISHRFTSHQALRGLSLKIAMIHTVHYNIIF
jgi:hypothetical protein